MMDRSTGPSAPEDLAPLKPEKLCTGRGGGIVSASLRDWNWGRRASVRQLRPGTPCLRPCSTETVSGDSEQPWDEQEPEANRESRGCCWCLLLLSLHGESPQVSLEVVLEGTVFTVRSMLSFALLKSPEENGLFSSYTLLHPRSPDSPPYLTVWVHGNLQAKETHFQPGPVDGSWLAFGWLLFSLGLHQTRLWLILQLCLYLTSRSLVDSNYC